MTGEKMKKIAIDNWERKKYYNFYKDYTYPFFSVTTSLKITKLIEYAKQNKQSFFPAFIYVVMYALNAIDNFKYRIRGDEVVLHDFVSPSYTVLNDKEQYVFCTSIYNPDFKEYVETIKADIARSKKSDRLEDIPGKDDLVFVSSLPWTDFTSVTHPIDTNNPDSFPRIIFGKYHQRDGEYVIPFNIYVHHGLCDGLHTARLFEIIETKIEELFG